MTLERPGTLTFVVTYLARTMKIRAMIPILKNWAALTPKSFTGGTVGPHFGAGKGVQGSP